MPKKTDYIYLFIYLYIYVHTYIYTGEHDVSTNFDRATRVRVARIHEHPGYNKDTLANDFSLLHLAEKVQLH